MSKWIVRTVAMVGIFSLFAGSALAQPKPKKKYVPECPTCHMALAAKPTKTMTVGMKLAPNKPVMYCCAKCKMPGHLLAPKEKGAGGADGGKGGKAPSGGKKP